MPLIQYSPSPIITVGQILDIPKPEPYTVTLHKISNYDCNECGAEIKADADIPEQEMLGKNLLSMISSL